MKILAIIPARLASTRLLEKVLRDIAGKSLIERVYEQVSKSMCIDNVIIAADSEKVFQHCLTFGGNVRMTSEHHQSGTDRCWEIAQEHPEYEIILNVQGDEPFINPANIDTLAELMKRKEVQIGSLCAQITNDEDLFNPNVVKTVQSKTNRALLFSRQSIPFQRAQAPPLWLQHFTYLRHIGLYGFKHNVLRQITAIPQSQLELIESLEQLRWLEHDFSIYLAKVDQVARGVDTMEDLEFAIQFAKERNL